MATITVHSVQVHGLHYTLDREFESACEAEDLPRLRQLIALGDQVGWETSAYTGGDARLPDPLLERLVALAWEMGNSQLADLHFHRARGGSPGLSLNGGPLEPLACSLLAFAEAHRVREVVA